MLPAACADALIQSAAVADGGSLVLVSDHAGLCVYRREDFSASAEMLPLSPQMHELARDLMGHLPPAQHVEVCLDRFGALVDISVTCRTGSQVMGYSL